jgi:outer membrane protein assembly factor BamB
MWRNRPTPESIRLAHYWDDLVTGAPELPHERDAADIDVTLVQTITWLERIDDAQPASADFSRKFETQFLQSIGATSPRLERSAGTLLSFPDHRDQREVRAPRSATTSHGRPLVGQDVSARHRVNGNWRILVSVAAAVLLVVSLVAIYYVLERREGLRDPNVILAPSTAIDVPMDRGNPARSGVMPGPGVSHGLESSWHFEAGRGGISAPAVVGDTVFIAGGSDAGGNADTQGSIVAIDASNGDERWRFPAKHVTSGTPAVAGGIVYAGDIGGIVYALDAEKGEEIWRADLQSGWLSAPVVVGDTVYIAAAPYRASLHVAVQDGTVVVGSGLLGQPEDGFRLYAFDRMTGEEQWQSGDDRFGQPGLFAFDAERGALIWRFEMPSLESGPAISGQRVYAGSTFDGTIYALDLSSGDEAWIAPTGEDLPLDSSPAISGGSVFVTTAYGSIICIDASSGEERWRADAEHISLNSSAIVVDGAVYVVDTASGVTALSAADGSVLWSEKLDLSGQVAVSPVIVNGNLYIGTSLEAADSAHVATLWAFTGSVDSNRDAREAP